MSDERSDTIVIIDGHAMAFRAYFALPPESFVNAAGQATNAVYGFIRMIFNVIKNEEPTYLAVAFDLPGGTFRDRMYPEYKAGRDATPEPFKGQIALIQQALDALGITWLTVEDFEADDIVASVATFAQDAGVLPLIVTSDRDAIQLVNETITLLQPVKGVTELRRMNPDAVVEKYLVGPQQYPDLAALVGESADNLPGVPGVGPKTAAKWIAEYGSLDRILENAELIKGKAGQSLRENVDAVTRNRAMNAAVRTLDVPRDLDQYRLGRAHLADIHACFDTLSFGATIRRDIPRILVKDDPVENESEPSVPNPELPVFVADTGSVARLLGHYAPMGGAIEAEGSYDAGDARCDAISIATESASIVLVPDALNAEDRHALDRWLRNSVLPKTSVDTKRCEHLVAGAGFHIRGWSLDVSIAEFLCRPDQRPTDLAGLSLRHLKEQIEPASAAAQQALQIEPDKDSTAESRAVRVRASYRLATLMRDELRAHAATRIHDEIELPLAMVLQSMEATGISVSTQRLEELDSEHAQRQAEVAREAYSHIGGEQVNLASPKQLQAVLFDRLGMPPTRKTKTGFSTDAESLADLLAKTQHPFLHALMAHRDVTKLRQIIETLRKSVSEHGRIHTTLSQNVAATGRLASSHPNVQNIPARTQAGRQIRSAFVTSPGYECLLTADYSQIEMRIMAHLSQDEGLIHAFQAGEDLHNFVASQVFGTPVEQVSAQERSKTKAISYGLAYGLSAFGLGRQLGISQSEAHALREQYFERFGGVQQFLRQSVELARTRGYTETLLGRRRYVPDLSSDNRQRRENAERVALNSPIQGSAADIIKIAMLRVQRAMDVAGLRSRLLLQVHDELIVEVAPGEREQVIGIVQEGMQHAYDLRVPMDVSIGWGTTWLEAAH